MVSRPLGQCSALLVCVLLGACPDDSKSSGDTATAPDTTPTDTAETTSPPDTGPADTADTSPEETAEDTQVTETQEETEVIAQPGSGEVEALEPEATSLVLPFDSALSPDGSVVYYVAIVGSGDTQGHQLFESVAGEERALTTDAGFVLPMGVLADGDSVYVLDAGYLPADAADGVREGAILAVSTGGGAPTVVAGTQGYGPVNGDVRDGTITFSGRDPADGAVGVFSVPSGGGSVSVVKKGAPLVSPSGVVRTSDGTVYVSDPIADKSGGAIIRVRGSDAAQLLGGLSLGTPSGIALSADEDYLLASAIDAATSTSVVLRIELASGTVTDTYQPDNIKNNREAGGLHCARDVEACVWADLTAGGDGTGIVYRVILK